MGVNHGGLDIGMTHQFLDRRKVDTAHYKVTGERMSQGVYFGHVIESTTPGDHDKPFPEPNSKPAAIFSRENKFGFWSPLLIDFCE